MIIKYYWRNDTDLQQLINQGKIAKLENKGLNQGADGSFEHLISLKDFFFNNKDKMKN